MSTSVQTITVVENNHIHEMAADLRRRMDESRRSEDNARVASGLRTAVLAAIVAESYDTARQDLEDYISVRSSFPAFQERAERYVRHCSELIQAIQTKRNFPGLASLSLSKQQEIHEKVLEHFEELKHNLKHIEKIERDNKLVDMRSTVWVVRAVSIWVGLVVLAAFVIELRSGVLDSTVRTTEFWLDQASTWFVNLVFR